MGDAMNSKIVLGDGTVLIDLTADTVSELNLGAGIKAHDKSGAQITGTAIISNNLTFPGKTVSTSSWLLNTDDEYPYKADIPCDGATSEHFPDVVFNDSDASSGIFSAISESYNGYVRIFAAEKPENQLTIPTIFLRN